MAEINGRNQSLLADLEGDFNPDVSEDFYSIFCRVVGVNFLDRSLKYLMLIKSKANVKNADPKTIIGSFPASTYPKTTKHLPKFETKTANFRW